MYRTIRVIFVLVFSLFLGACSGAILTTKDPAQRVLVYGSLDMSKSGKAVKDLVVKSNQKIPTAAGGRFSLYKFPQDGFYTVNDLLPGYTYNIVGFRSLDTSYYFGEKRPKGFDFTPGPADMVYVGAYRYTPHERSAKEVLTDSGTFSLDRDTKLTESDVLRKIRNTVGDAHWERRIDERLKQLGNR